MKTLPYRCKVHCWSDSMVVLSWIKEEPLSKFVLVYALHSLEYVLGLARFRVFVPNIYIYIKEQSSNFNIFVSNSIALLQNLTNQMSWHYVPTKSNPADLLSRGSIPEELLKCTIWTKGPAFLYLESSQWPAAKEFIAELPERRKNVLVVIPLSDFSMQCKYQNSYYGMQRIFAYFYRFLNLKTLDHVGGSSHAK